MTDRIKALALWMGWTVEPPSIDSPHGWYRGSPNEMDVGEWDPSVRIQDAMMLIDRIESLGYSWEIGNNHAEGRRYCLLEQDMTQFLGLRETTEEAIVRAVEMMRKEKVS